MPGSQPVRVEPYFGGFILETLTVGMYGESKNALREYVQNSFDSIQRARQLKLMKPSAGLIKIEMAGNGDKMVLRDDGAGLPAASAVRTLTSIGASSKDYKQDAGFRGIGRLSGIVFSDKVIFRTKAAGEDIETTVTYNARAMREAMSPSQGSALSAHDMISKFVTASQSPSPDISDHFFEVTLAGFEDAPEECTSALKLREFLGQVAPVPYSDAFPAAYKKRLADAQKASGFALEEVRVEVHEPGNVIEVTKHYSDEYELGKEDSIRMVKLSDIQIRSGADWWGWFGEKDEPGQYANARVSGLRVRVKNIQIDGTEVFREIFKQQAKSYIRFQDWFVGEFFVKPDALVPNARRDGFEENAPWKKVRKEWGDLVKELGEQAYTISEAGQTDLDKLLKKAFEAKEEFEALQRSDFKNKDRTLQLAMDVTKLQRNVAKAAKTANPRTLPELQAMASELADIKVETVAKLNEGRPAASAEQIGQDAREELLMEIMTIFESELQAPCLSAVRALLRKHYSVG